MIERGTGNPLLSLSLSLLLTHSFTQFTSFNRLIFFIFARQWWMNCDWATLCAHSIQMGSGHGMSELMVCCSMCTQDAHACLSSCRECNHKFYWNYFIDKLMFSLHIQSRVHASTICLAYPFRPSPTTHKIVWFCHHYVYAFRLYAGICFFCSFRVFAKNSTDFWNECTTFRANKHHGLLLKIYLYMLSMA